VLKLIRDAGATAIDKMAKFAGGDAASNLASVMKEYESNTDPEFLSLRDKAAAGDTKAGADLHRWVSRNELGGGEW